MRFGKHREDSLSSSCSSSHSSFSSETSARKMTRTISEAY